MDSILPKFPKISIIRHNKFHYPNISDEIIEPIPYLRIPFNREELEGKYKISEGWIYSKQEQSIHGFKIHGGIDFAVPFGSTIYAPFDGYAISSYHSFWLKNEDGSQRMYEGKAIRFGLGYFIQLYNPIINRFVQLGHLSEIAETIPFSKPNKVGENWLPTNHSIKIQELANHQMVTFVHKGDFLGKVGTSGLGWGYEEYDARLNRPIPMQKGEFISFDEPHLHIEDCFRDQESGKKGWQRDPYDLYLTASNYPTNSNKKSFGLEPLFIIDEDGLPEFIL